MADETVVTEQTQEEAPKVETTPLETLFSKEVPAKEASPVEEKTEPVAETPAEPEKTEEPKTEVKTEEKPVEPSPEEKVRMDYEKRLKDNRDWTTRVNQENAELKRVLAQQQIYLEKVSKQLDGTWSEADEQRMQQAQQQQTPSIEEVATQANYQGRLAASIEAAYAQHGKEFVDDFLQNPNSPIMPLLQDKVVMTKIMESPAPVMEAIKISEARSFFDKWATYNPTELETRIREDERKKMTEEITNKVMKSLNRQGTIPQGLRDVKSIDVGSQPFHTPLDQLFRK